MKAQLIWMSLKQNILTHKTNLTKSIHDLKINLVSITNSIWVSLQHNFNPRDLTFVELRGYWIALCWQQIYKLRNKLNISRKNNGLKFSLILLLAIAVISVYLVPKLQNQLEPYLAGPDHLALIRELFINLGSALIGATAIAFSLIMFAMQVNVERMPHGLFRKFSSDTKLLTTFITTFTLASLTAGVSLIPDKSWVAAAAVTSIWCLFLILLLFGLAYRRALDLISPTKQLKLLEIDTKNNFKTWDIAIKRSKPIFRKIAQEKNEDADILRKHDLDRLSYFQLYPNWTTFAEQSIVYCISFSRRFAEHGDHEVSGAALTSIVEINASYIQTKGKTFFTNVLMFDNPLTSDSFISNTLEHLRQNIQIAIANKDEQFIEQNLQCFTQLTHLYLSIDYGDENADRYHAHLATGYLTGAVESIIPHDMADVLIEGVSLLGNAARLIIQYDKPQFIPTISKKIALIACTGVTKHNYRVVTQIAVKQLASITFDLLRCENSNIRYAIKEVRTDIKLIAEVFLTIKDTPISSVHSTSLAPYYSATSQDSLSSSLTKLINALLKLEPENKDAKRIISNIEDWSDELFQTEKELLLKSVEARSQLTFDLIYWIQHVTKLLLAISVSDACPYHNSEKLKKSALWLISVFTWIPGDEATVKYMGTYQIVEKLFESALDAHHLDCTFEALDIRKLLLSWTRKVGKYQTGWGTLEEACCALACLNLTLGLADEILIQDIDTYITSKDAPSFEIRSRTSSDLHVEAESYHARDRLNVIDNAMSYMDQTKLKILLHKVASHLLPETLDQESKKL